MTTRMNYDLATNFDNELIEKVADFGIIKGIYGKLSSDAVGGGRPSLILPSVNRKKLRNHIDKCHNKDIEFNYLLNATCSGNKELIGKSHREITQLIDEVVEDGADSVTVATYNMLDIVKSQFPDLKVSASIFLNGTNITNVLKIEERGANQITLGYNFTRNFGLLKKISSLIKDETSIRLLANNVCLHDCPYRIPGHANLLSHSSTSKDPSTGFTIDPYTLNCGMEKLKDPAEFIMSDWIRPEDVKEYKEIKNLSLKLTDRARPTDWLVNVVKAYSEEKYEGNLFDIINWIGSGKYAQIHKGGMIKGALTGKGKVTELMKLEKATFLPQVYINNRDLDGFLEHFKNNPCSDKLCYTETKNYGDCKHCYNIASKIVKINEEKRQDAIKTVSTTIDSINSGRMFGK